MTSPLIMLKEYNESLILTVINSLPSCVIPTLFTIHIYSFLKGTYFDDVKNMLNIILPFQVFLLYYHFTFPGFPFILSFYLSRCSRHDSREQQSSFIFIYFSAVFPIRIMPQIYIFRIEVFLDSICHLFGHFIILGLFSWF